MPITQVLRAQVQYVDTPTLQGVRYVTLLRLDVSPFLGNEFLYTFQGISADGATYVSAVFHLNTTLFPAELPTDYDFATFEAQYPDYVTQSAATLNSATPDQFTPSLATLDAVIQSFTIGGSVPPADATAPAPTIQATPTVEDTVMGGLAGTTWTLVSYGDPANPTPALDTPPVTLTFSGSGVSGNAGCNSFSGGFTFEGNTLMVGQLVSTLMACLDQPVMDQEAAVLAALSTASRFAINGNQLVIRYDGGVLNFTGA
jgi:heat shock protein HslJ